MAMKVGHLVSRAEVNRRSILRAHWVWSVKSDSEGKVTRFKARYVVDGSAVPESIYSPVINMNIMRAMLVYALRKGLHIHLIDIKHAFLNGPLNESYFIEQIRLYEDPSKPTHVMKLDRSVYGLPQSAYNWFTCLNEFLVFLGLIQSDIERCLFYSPACVMFVLIHVDDMNLLVEHEADLNTLKQRINEKFKLTDRGVIRECLGTDYFYLPQHGRLYMSQERKIVELYEQFKEHVPKATELPIPSKTDLYEPSEKFADVHLYMSGIGSCNYLGIWTRPDILIYVNKLSSFMRSPTKHHFKLLMRVVAHLYRTRKQHLKYSNRDYERAVVVYADASAFGIEQSKGRHTTGAVVELYGNAVQWITRKQSIVTDEICAAELYALNVGLKQGLHVRNLLDEVKLLPINDITIQLRGDNRSSILIAGQGLKSHSNHYNSTLLHVRDFVERGEVEIKPIASSFNPADLLTKFCDLGVFRKLVDLLGLKLVVGRERCEISGPGEC